MKKRSLHYQNKKAVYMVFLFGSPTAFIQLNGKRKTNYINKSSKYNTIL